MKKIFLSIMMIASASFAFAQLNIRGIFVGMEEIKDFSDPSQPKYKWYHLSELRFTRDSVFLEQSPIAIYKKDTIYSASDGGFYTYAGTIGLYEGRPYASLNLVHCDYCPRKMTMFTPPKIVKDEELDTSSKRSDSADSKIETRYEDWDDRQIKIMVLKKIDSNTILVNKNIYKRKK